MSLLDDAAALDASLAPASATGAESTWNRFEALLARWSERLNPILVKEARQALRSRQFTTTFFLMLASGWTWSILGLALIGPAVYYSADGPTMFLGYHIILAFPLMVVAPYAAFHSLSAERQDRTYELVSITALGATQILSGKLCAVMLQMAVYLSAIGPCLAFTYLLRGLDIFTIFLAVFYTVAMSLGLAVVGLLLATLAASRQRQLGQSVLFALALFGSFWANVAMISELTSDASWSLDQPGFWEVNLAFATFYVNAFALSFLAARSQLTTVCQNRSTALRAALVVAQLSLFGWFAWAQMRWTGNFQFGLVFCSTLLWTLAGMFMVGESSDLPPRVKRDLPQSLLGRIFLTLFAPGAGTGYLFVLASMVAVTLMACLPYDTIAQQFRSFAISMNVSIPNVVSRSHRDGVFWTGLFATSYLAIYLGLSKLILEALRRFGEVRLTLRILVNLLLLLLGSGIPWVVQVSNPATRNFGYTLLQISNPVWTLWECCTRSVPAEYAVLAIVLPVSALVVLVLNLPSLARELAQVRVARPGRVQEEDAQLAAQAAGPPQPASPWG